MGNRPGGGERWYMVERRKIKTSEDRTTGKRRCKRYKETRCHVDKMMTRIAQVNSYFLLIHADLFLFVYICKQDQNTQAVSLELQRKGCRDQEREKRFSQRLKKRGNLHRAFLECHLIIFNIFLFLKIYIFNF